MILGLLLLVLSIYLFLLTPFGQNWLTQRVLHYLSGQWQTRIELKNARFSLFDKIQLESLTVYDSQSDTLLHAGQLEVRITNWFFLRKKNELGPIYLKHALVQIQRDDSTWQHAALFSQFAGSGGSTSSGGSEFNLRELHFEDVTFRMRDAWLGSDLQAKINSLELKANRLNPSDSTFDIERLLVDQPSIELFDYPGRRPAVKQKPPIDPFKITEWPIPPQLTLAEFKLTGGRLRRTQKGQAPRVGRFDPSNMHWTDLQVSLNEVNHKGGTLQIPLRGSGKEFSGLSVDSLSATLNWSSHGLRIELLKIKTPRSLINQTIDWAAQGNGSAFRVLLEENRIDPADVNLFLNKPLPFADLLLLRGQIDITGNQVLAKQVWAQWGSGARISGDLKATEWRDAKNWQVEFTRSEAFVRSDFLVRFVKFSSSEKAWIDRIGYAQIRGKGSINGLKATWDGTLRTQAGSLQSIGEILYAEKNDPIYQVRLNGQLDGLHVLLPGSGVRSAQLQMQVNGTGIKSLFAEGTLKELATNTYRFEPIRFKLNGSDPTWDLQLETRDPNLTGNIEFSGEPFQAIPVWGLNARLEKMNLTQLGWNSDGLELKGSLQGRFTGKDISDLQGELQGHSLELTRNDVPLSLQEFDLKLQQQAGYHDLRFRSNELDADVQGRFEWNSLPNLAMQLGNRYFPSWIPPTSLAEKTDSIHFRVRTYNIEDYLELLHAPVRGLSNAQLKGDYQSLTGVSSFHASIPKLQIGTYLFHQTELNALGNPDSLHMDARVKRIQWNDSISIPEAQIKLDASRDTANIRLMAGFSGAVDKADIQSRLIAYRDGLQLDLSPSTFLIQGKLWHIDEDGQLVIRRNQPTYGKLSLREGDQRIDVRSIPDEAGDKNDIEVRIQSLNLHDIAPFFLPANELEGLLSGRIRIQDPTGNLRIKADTLQTRLLRFDNDSIGELGASLVYDHASKRLTGAGQTLGSQDKLKFDARIDLAGAVDSNRIQLQAQSYPIKILERFLGHLFSDIRGKLTGDVELSGDLNNPALYGSGRITDAGLRVNYTNCFYSIQDAEIEVTPNLIDLDGWVLRDSVTGNPIYVNGGIAHESFSDMYFDLSLTTRSRTTNVDRPVLLLNTDKSQDEVYYGVARGTANMQLRGPQSDLVLSMQAKASERDSSYITLLSDEGRESGSADFLIERVYGREMTSDDSRGETDNFLVDMELTATPLVNARVVLDELTGDVIRGRGNGILKLRSGSNEPLSLRGRYNIEEGNYLFTFQSFFKKPFEIRKGGQHYVEWSGDPYDANVHLEAIYKAEKVSFAPLGSSLNLGSSLKNARGDVFVVAELSDKLFKPEIRFSLTFPPNSIVDRDQELSLLINQLQKNPNELNRQVTYLIVFNSFAPSELAGDPTGTGIGVSTISGVLLNVLSDQINKLLGNLLKSDKYTINLNTSLYNRDWMSAGNNALNLGSNINFSIGRSFFNNRFIISGGLGFDAPIGQSSTSTNLSQSIQLLPDVTMEWLLNPSGSLRVGFFYRKSNDFLSNNAGSITARRAGGSLSYQKEYDRLGDLFKGLFRYKKKERPETEQR